LIALALNRKKGLPVKLAATKPRSKATGGEIRPETQINKLQNELLYFNTSSKESKFIFRTNFRVSKLMLNCYATKMWDKSDFTNHIK
jgi:hypothetical protein